MEIGASFLNWSGPLKYDNLLRIEAEGDGSCFFHAILIAIFAPYKTEKIGDLSISRKEIVTRFRKGLSDSLSHTNEEGKTKYSLLGNGIIEELGKEMKEYSLEYMQKELELSLPVGNQYNEHVSNEISRDIYILDATREDVYMTGDKEEYLYKNRNSVVLLYYPGHYELIGVKEGDMVITDFDPSHPFIQLIKRRMKELVK